MNYKHAVFSNINQRMKSPVFFLFFSIIFQVILIIINLRCYYIISGEMTDSMKLTGHNLFISEIILLLLLSLIPVIFHFLNKKLLLSARLILLFLPVIYLFVFSVNIDDVIPTQVRIWIMPVERVLFYQFIFIMPVVFYLILSIASFKSGLKLKQELFFSVMLMACPPFLTYLLYNLLYNFLYRKFDINEYILPVFLIIATGVMLFALIRIILILYHLFANKSRVVESTIYFIIGVIMPLGGLILNYYIPFPADFQNTPVYLLAVFNGISLTVPNTANKKIDNIAAVLRLILFPFTLYFFIVFLPFLPLSIPAILAMGAGFLILTPTLLFVLHLRRLISDIRINFQMIKLKKRAAIIAFSLLLIPCLITLNAIMDKAGIHQALNYIYEPDYLKIHKFNGSRIFVKHGLESLERKKSGIYLPFVSGFYDWLVFDNLVLPDSKMNYMYRAFFGRDMKISERKYSDFAFLLGATGHNRIQPVVEEFTISQKVKISNIQHSSKSENNFIRTRVRIEMKNLDMFQQEFRTSISIPEGVFVSNYWLYVGDDRVPGKLFEKKTATWIYQMIRSSMRDPGLLFYKNPGLLYLYVFPFSNSEKRITEIEFLYPKSISPEISIGDNKLRFNMHNHNENNAIAFREKDQLSVLLSEKIKARMPKVQRVPYFHFLVDWSEYSGYANSGILNKIETILRRFPDIQYCSITLANYETANITGGIIPVEAINNIDTGKIGNSIKARGGFCRDRAIKSILLNSGNELLNSVLKDEHFLYYPVIFVIRDSNTKVLDEDNFYYFSKLYPDVKYYYTYENNKIYITDFNGRLNNRVRRISPERIIIVKSAGEFFYLAADKNDIIHDKTTDKSLSLKVYNAGSGKFQGLGFRYYDGGEQYAKGLQAESYCRERVLNPSLSPDLFKPVVMMSKKTGILNQMTSYIVVENTAQWKMLEQKEKDKLNNKESLEIVDTPEPPIIILSGLFLLFLIIRIVKDRIGYSKGLS